MQIGDVVYLKSGGPAMTVSDVNGGFISVNWFFRDCLTDHVFVDATLTSDNPEPALVNKTAKLVKAIDDADFAAQPVVNVVVATP